MVNNSKRKKRFRDLKAVESYLPKTSTEDWILFKDKTVRRPAVQISVPLGANMHVSTT